MRFGFITPGVMDKAIASQLQPFAGEVVLSIRETDVERSRHKTGVRP
jgi:hypothetical protein